jgi:hypothetical protein
MAHRDFALIKAAQVFLKSQKCESYHMSMNSLPLGISDTITEPFTDTLNQILPSFLATLWRGGWDYKKEIMKTLNPIVEEYHPSPIENLEYLTKTFNYTFNEDTVNTVSVFQQEWESVVRHSTLSSIELKPYTIGNPILGLI